MHVSICLYTLHSHTYIFCIANYHYIDITTSLVLYVQTCTYARVYVHTQTHFH